MEDCVPKPGPTVSEAPAVLPEEPGALEDRTPLVAQAFQPARQGRQECLPHLMAPRPTFTRTYPVFGYE